MLGIFQPVFHKNILCEVISGLQSGNNSTEGSEIFSGLPVERKREDYRMNRAVLSFISCSGKREDNIRSAIQAVEQLPDTTVIAKSGQYETEPQKLGQLEYGCVSSCAVILTGMLPGSLYGACVGIAAALGRNPDSGRDESSIDIGLLVYEGQECRNAEITLPNHELLKLPWVIKPLSELFKDGKALDYDFSSVLKK